MLNRSIEASGNGILPSSVEGIGAPLRDEPERPCQFLLNENISGLPGLSAIEEYGRDIFLTRKMRGRCRQNVRIARR